MKNKVLNFLKNTDQTAAQFNEGLGLLIGSAGSPRGIRNYNNQGFSPQRLETLRYDLMKIHGIKEADIVSHVPEVQPEPVAEVEVNVQRKASNLSNAGKEEFRNVLRDLNENQKSGLKFAEQYPFLREKDVPNEFKILTADAISAFHSYRDAHEKLFAELAGTAEPKLSLEEVYSIASELVEDFKENREIHKELEHYQKKKEILGQHKIFADLKLQREVDAIVPAKLGSTKTNLASNISKKEKAIRTEKDADRKAALKEDVARLKKKKALVEARIKNSESK